MNKQNIIAKHSESKKIMLRVAVIVVIANVVLVALKSVFGFVFSNVSVLSDAAHSAADLVSSLFVIIAALISSPKRDKKHNYGHEKTEPLMVLFLSLVLAVLVGMLIWQGIEGIISPADSEVNVYLISVTIFSIVLKEALFWYGIHYAKKINSEMLRADAWHSRADCLSSVAVLIGLLSAIFMRSNIIESIAVLFVALLIGKIALGFFVSAVKQLTDSAAQEETANEIKEIALETDGVKSVENLRTRVFGKSIYVDIVIGIDENLTVNQAHEIAKTVHDVLEEKDNLRIKHCTVSIVPSKG